MSDFYADMAKMASDVLAPTSQGGLGQGSVILKRITTEWIDPEQQWLGKHEVEQQWPLKAAVKRLNHRNINGVLISEIGDELVFADPGFAPLLSDLLVIDGVNRSIDEVRPIPGAGTVAAYKVWSKA